MKLEAAIWGLRTGWGAGCYYVLSRKKNVKNDGGKPSNEPEGLIFDILCL